MDTLWTDDRDGILVWRLGLLVQTPRGLRLGQYLGRFTLPQIIRLLVELGTGRTETWEAASLQPGDVWTGVCDYGCGLVAGPGCVCGIHGITDLTAVPDLDLDLESFAQLDGLFRAFHKTPGRPPTVALHQVRLSGIVSLGASRHDPPGTLRGSRAHAAGRAYVVHGAEELARTYGIEASDVGRDGLAEVVRKAKRASAALHAGEVVA